MIPIVAFEIIIGMTAILNFSISYIRAFIGVIDLVRNADNILFSIMRLSMDIL